MTVPETIYTQEPGKYHAQKTVGGWVVVYIDDRHNMRLVDGSKVHKNRQNAYAKAKRLNDRLPKTLEEVLKKADVAWYEFDNYTVAVGDARPIQDGFEITVAKEALPPHIHEYRETLDEVESYLDGTLGYTRGSRVWKAVEREDD